MIDNIPRSTVIRDATIERFSTSGRVHDGVGRAAPSRALARYPCSPVTRCRWGDGGGRTLTIGLTAERPDPGTGPSSTRTFSAGGRPSDRDPQGRAPILLGPALLNCKNSVETRFRYGFILVGSAVEHAKARQHAGSNGGSVRPQPGRGR
jgi:hypothetical protein